MVVENWQGKGLIFDGDQQVAEAEYNLDVVQDFAGGPKRAIIEVKLVEGEENLFHRNNLTLRLEDGRSLGITVTGFDMNTGASQFQAKGPPV